MVDKVKLHINPLRLSRVSAVESNDTPPATNEGQSMPLNDAALISFILSIAQYFIVFLALKGYGDLVGAPLVFCFDSLKFLGGTFFSNLIVLSGLSKYVANSKK